VVWPASRGSKKKIANVTAATTTSRNTLAISRRTMNVPTGVALAPLRLLLTRGAPARSPTFCVHSAAGLLRPERAVVVHAEDLLDQGVGQGGAPVEQRLRVDRRKEGRLLHDGHVDLAGDGGLGRRGGGRLQVEEQFVDGRVVEHAYVGVPGRPDGLAVEQ